MEVYQISIFTGLTFIVEQFIWKSKVLCAILFILSLFFLNGIMLYPILNVHGKAMIKCYL